jgi:hypothetical protein
MEQRRNAGDQRVERAHGSIHTHLNCPHDAIRRFQKPSVVTRRADRSPHAAGVAGAVQVVTVAVR